VCQIQFHNLSSLLACSIYRPPSSNEPYLKKLCQQLSSCFPNAALWIGGDINLPDINWSNSINASHSYSLGLNNSSLDFLDNNALSRMVDFSTSGTNTFDIFVTDRPALVENCNVVDRISDHEAVLVTSLITAALSLLLGELPIFGPRQILTLPGKTFNHSANIL